MSIATKFDPIDREVLAMLAQDLGPAERSAALADFAREQLADAQAANRAAIGITPPHETFVDGSRGAAVESVSPEGIVVFEFDLLVDMLEWIGEQLVKASPVLTGRYARSHVLEVDGSEITLPGPIPVGRKYLFVNRQPYARKIEPKRFVRYHRDTKGRNRRRFVSEARTGDGQSPQAPDGVYQAVAAMAKARFGNIAKVEFILNYFDYETGVSHPAIRITQ